MKNQLLELLQRNARYTIKDLATMLDTDEKSIETAIEELENDGVICGYKTVVDHEKLDDGYVSAIVQLNVVPKADLGFEEVAEKVMSYKAVETCYLVSGSYDLHVVVKGKTLQDVSRFVARELATIDSVTSTVTNFVMRRYKDLDVELIEPEEDTRGQYLL